jgi:hypothetical protein
MMKKKKCKKLTINVGEKSHNISTFWILKMGLLKEIQLVARAVQPAVANPSLPGPSGTSRACRVTKPLIST